MNATILPKLRFTARPMLCRRIRKFLFGPMRRSTRQQLRKGKLMRPTLPMTYALTQVLTKGGTIKVPAETVLTFQLDKPRPYGSGKRLLTLRSRILNVSTEGRPLKPKR